MSDTTSKLSKQQPASLHLRRQLPQTTTGKPRGGKRAGAGRKSNAVKHLAKLESTLKTLGPMREQRSAQLQLIIGSPNDPLLLLINEARDRSNTPEIRVIAASHAARYVHPTLASQQIAMTHTSASVTQSDVMARLEERLGRLNPPLILEAIVTPEGDDPESTDTRTTDISADAAA